MNPHKFNVELYELAKEGTDSGKVWQKYRQNEDVQRMFGAKVQNPKDGSFSSTMYRNELNEAAAASLMQVAEGKRHPFLHAQLEVAFKARQLASDCIEAMEELTPKDPRALRRGLGIYQQLFKEPKEPVLEMALDYLDEFNVATTKMREMFTELFPPIKDEEEDTE